MRGSPLVALAFCLLWWVADRPPLDAQVRDVYDRGAAGLVQVLQRLQTTASTLHAGAHPDDEDSAFIARMARGDHARVAYLSLNRGEGGQNIIGTELFDALGVIAAEGRSQHKSQEMGTLELLGPAATGLRLLESVVPTPAVERSIFDGIDTSVTGIGRLTGLPDGLLQSELHAIADAAARALQEYLPLEPQRLVPVLVSGLRATRAARVALASATVDGDARFDADFLLSLKEEDFVEALTRATGVIVDPLADDETIVQGGTSGVTVRTFVASPAHVRIISATVAAPAGWTVENTPTDDRASDAPFARRETPTHAARFQVTVPRNAPLTQPYYLERPREGDRYQWGDEDPKGLPFARPLLTGVVELEISGVPLVVSRAVQYRFADRVRGELRRDVNVVPLVEVALESRFLIVPVGGTEHRQRVVVRASSFSDERIDGTLRLQLPQGWESEPREARFTFSAKGQQTSTSFVLIAPATRAAGGVEVAAEAVLGGSSYSRSLQAISYPHIQTHRVYAPATASVQVLDLAVSDVRVGYIMGSGDQVPDALRRMGVDVSLLDDEELATGELTRFDTIVVGIRASEARPAFVANHGRLMAYLEGGGTLIVQYQQTGYVTRNLPPLPAQSPSNSRVTDETAPVSVLVPDHPVFTFPNRITTADFDGWGTGTQSVCVQHLRRTLRATARIGGSR